MSIKKNYLASLGQTFANLLFPLITFPYVARVLGPENIGKVEYANSIVYYFLAFAHIGIPLYGTREVAKYKDDPSKLGKIITELLLIYLGTTVLTVISLYSYIFFLGENSDQNILLAIAGASILSSAFSLSWALQGLEKHRYLSLFSIISRLIYVLLLYVLVTDRSDYTVYLCLMIFVSYFMCITSFLVLKKYVVFSFKNLAPTQHFKPIILTSGISLSEALLFQANTVMLGVLTSPMQVGIYAASFRVIRLAEGLITSLGKIAMPRITFYIKECKTDELHSLNTKILSATVLLAIPATFGVYLVADALINILAGEEYHEAILCLKIIAPYITIMSITSFMLNQVLFPAVLDTKIISRNVILIVSTLCANFILIPKLGAVGASLSIVTTSLIGLLLYIAHARSHINFSYITRDNLKSVISALIMLALVSSIPDSTNLNLAMSLSMKVLVSIVLYSASLIASKHSLVMSMIHSILSRRSRA